MFASLLQRSFRPRSPEWRKSHVHWFADDSAAHDYDVIETLYEEFSAERDQVADIISSMFGRPIRTGADEDDLIPISGIFRFAVWEREDRPLYVAAAHEDGGCPVLLMVGTEKRDDR